jgi:RNA-directed DNA polymerase
VPTLEDKIVQGAVAETLSAIYEVDFLGFSYGFRPGRNPHKALASLHTAPMSQRVNWVLDADIRSSSTRLTTDRFADNPGRAILRI